MGISIKRVSRRINVLLIFFVTFALFTLSAVAIASAVTAQSSFTPRLTAPESDNEYYYSDMNVFYKYGYPMPNCTAYAYGRAYEILGEEPRLSWNSAERWFTDNEISKAYKTGTTPKLGAVACWSYDGGGHVAVVEKITDDEITFSNSGYGYKNFYLTTAKLSDKNPGQDNWTFQGYIYIGEFESGDIEPPTEETEKQYIITSTNGVNLRDKPSTDGEKLTAIPKNVIITVTETTASQGYTWGKTQYNGFTGWCVLDFAEKISGEPTEPTTQPTTESATETTEETEPTTEFEPSTDEQNTNNILYGDTNSDGRLSITDATLIQYMLADRVVFSEKQMLCADFNRSSRVDVADVTAIQKTLAQ